MQLTFTDDAIETICPETVTYCKAKESITNFWRLNSRAKRHPAANKRRIRTEPEGIVFQLPWKQCLLTMNIISKIGIHFMQSTFRKID